MIIMIMSSKNTSIFGISLRLKGWLDISFGPKIKDPYFLENTGSVIIVVSPSLIKKVA